MDAQQQLLGAMLIVEDQHKAINDAIEALAAERAQMRQVLWAMQKAAEGVQQAAGDAATASVTRSLGGASIIATEALGEATRPVVERLLDASKTVSRAEQQLNGAMASFGWKWPVLCWGVVLSAIAALLVVTWLTLAWQRSQVETLKAEVAELQAAADDLAKRGGRTNLTVCGEKKRLCARIDNPNQSYGKERDYFVLKGY